MSFERLVDGLWGEGPPSSAPKMVQQYVSQLRRLLVADGRQIITRDGGYELRVDPSAVDALRFERLVEQAAHEADGRRSELAHEALAIWQDPPLAGMREEPFAASEARRLEELHLAALELAIEGDLDAGRHAELVGRLAALVDEHPLRSGWSPAAASSSTWASGPTSLGSTPIRPWRSRAAPATIATSPPEPTRPRM